MKKTNRGFSIYGEYKDSHKNTVTIQKSSAACIDAVWIFVKDSTGSEIRYDNMKNPCVVSAHLTRPQAKRVAIALLKFAREE